MYLEHLSSPVSQCGGVTCSPYSVPLSAIKVCQVSTRYFWARQRLLCKANDP